MTPNNFWLWFKGNELQSLDDGASIADAIHSKLGSIDNRLGVEVSDRVEGVCNVIFTANGNSDLFGLVRSLVESAPVLENWHFIALKQAQGFDFEFEKGGSRITPSDWQFLGLKVGDGNLGIRILIPGHRNMPIHVLAGILETGVGEERLSCVKHLEYCHDFGAVPAKSWGEIQILATYIDLFKTRTT